jgi:hypothetical protein
LTQRLFLSISHPFARVTSQIPDFREFIPEFFTTPDFLVNENHFDLGSTDGHPVDDVILPAWAHGSSHRFIDLHRQALESLIVSAHLHEWVDLVFGFANDGPAAIKAQNTFHAYSYASSLTPEVMAVPE